MNLRIGVEGDVSPQNPGEDRLKRVVVFLGDWIELVGVTAGAIGRRTGEGGHRLRHDVVAFEVLERHRGG